MKSISLAVIIIGVLLLLGCQQDPEVLEGQAAQALEQLSDEELARVEEETARMGEGVAIAGQGYKISVSATPTIRNAANSLQRLNQNSRQILIQRERDTRRLAGAVRRAELNEPCRENNDCLSNLCGRDEFGDIVCEERNQPEGNICFGYNNEECAPGLICGRSEDEERYDFVCESPNPLGSRCLYRVDRSEECVSGLICGVTDEGYFACEFPNPLNSRCHSNDECAEGLICRPDGISITRNICGNPAPVGNLCYNNQQCASGDCSSGRCR